MVMFRIRNVQKKMYLFIIVALSTQSPNALNVKIEIHVRNGHGAASEIGWANFSRTV